MAVNAFRSMDLRYWVVCKITEGKFIAKERSATSDAKNIIEGSLEVIRHRIRNMDFRDVMSFRPNPEKIVELWF